MPAIVQPGGSVRDDEVIAAADAHGMAMVFTGQSALPALERRMNILIIGSGGREHALAWKIAGVAARHALCCAPGNAGIAEVAELVPVAADDVAGLARASRETKRIDLDAWSARSCR